MVRGLVRAAAYLPRASDGQRRIGAHDEDAFTFAATALELAAGEETTGGRPATVRALGDSASLEATGLGAVLGAPVRLVPPGAGADPLGEALSAAAAAAGPAWIVVVAADDADRPGALAGPPGEGAAALLVDDRPGTVPLPRTPGEGVRTPSGTPLARLFDAARTDADARAWIGDWTVDPTRGANRAERVARAGRPGLTVSQGAFVPLPRYEEGLASRWRFVAERCRACSARTFPARGRCRNCGTAEALRAEPLPLHGAVVVASTWIGRGGQPTEFDVQVETTGPYGVVLAELAADARVTLMVTEGRPDEVRVGSRVDTVLRRLYSIEGAWRYGRKAIPARPAPNTGEGRSPGGAGR